MAFILTLSVARTQPPLTDYFKQSIMQGSKTAVSEQLKLPHNLSVGHKKNMPTLPKRNIQCTDYSFLEAVLNYNPEIKAQRYLTEAAKTQIDQAQALEIMISQYAGFIQRSAVNVNVAGIYPFPGVQAAKMNVANYSYHIAQAQKRKLVRNVVTRASQIKVLFWYEKQLINILTEEKERAERILSTTTRLYEQGRSDFSSLTAAKVRQSELKTQIILSEQTVANLLSEAKYLAGGKTVDIQPPDGDCFLNFNARQVSVKTALINREELHIAKSQLGRLREMRSMLLRMTMPEMALTVQRPDQSKIMVNSQPAFGFYQAFLAQTDNLIEASIHNLQNTKNSIKDDIQQSVSDLNSAEKIYRVFRAKILPDQKAALQTAISLYESGEFDYNSLMQAENRWSNALKNSLSAQKRLYMTKVKAVSQLGLLPVLEVLE